MNNLNSILIEGNLVRDPELRHTPKGTAVAVFTLASNRYHKIDDGFEKEVSFFEVEAWSKLAESVEKRGKKGRGVRVVGRLKQDRWVGSDGKNRAKVMIVAEHVEFRPDFKRDSDSLVKVDEQEYLVDMVPKDEDYVNDEETEVETVEETF